ncbi:Pre-mRNA-splicing factor [Spathaspora sp. JA1]|nr:Pre-mRNA-splicing factor [Spathaspora sp. JA1]
MSAKDPSTKPNANAVTKADLMSKPARLQVDPATIPDSDKPPQVGTTFNIWFLKWSGGDSSTRSFTQSKFKVNVKRDSGYTKAGKRSPICLFFARGCCYRGKSCPYFHRLPLPSEFFPTTQDCFGRDKTAEYRDDMDGVGSFNKVNRTLYVGGLHIKPEIEEVISKYFSEFGDIDKIKVIHNKSCAFITMRYESSAQFAKEAMQNQSLGGQEVLYVRWANEDPNPEAQKREKRRLEELALETVRNLLQSTEQATNSSKRSKKIIVEEPKEEEEEEKYSEVKKIKSVEETPVQSAPILSSSTLQNLAKVRDKLSVRKVIPTEQTLSTVLGGYSSEEEDDDE